ncbi:MAG TPA: hypothetical protein VKY85_25055 [Candidatus Angelobacter sp.]|nr:hypothetical protein [Candidatus Angelobacter sp.]
MPKETSPPRLPPLPLNVLDDVRDILDYAEDETRGGFKPPPHNAVRTVELLRSCAVEIVAVKVKHYFSLPNRRSEWLALIKNQTIDSLLAFVLNRNLHKDISAELNRTIEDHYVSLRREWEESKEPTVYSAPVDRKALRIAYFAKFPETEILDVCWAAGQHYSEWKRWLRNAVKDDSAPDRAFRAILESGKPPSQYKTKPRPHGWK